MRARIPAAAVLLILLSLLAGVAAGHEVYVLPADAINESVSTPSPNPVVALQDNLAVFLLAAFIAAALVAAVFWAGTRPEVEERFAGPLAAMEPYASVAGRVTLGIALLASAYNGALFGPELPFGMFGPAVPLRVAVALLGGLILSGFLTGWAALAALLLYVVALFQEGAYMLMYAEYAGLAVYLLGTCPTRGSINHGSVVGDFDLGMGGDSGPFSTLVLRVLFGLALISASIYAKFLHSNLALATVARYDLTAVLPFDPMLIVLGALLTEVGIGLFFLLGFQVRFAAIGLTAVLGLSFAYFGEALWPHVAVVGTALVLFLHGYDRYTLGEVLKRRLAPEDDRDPVL